MRLARVLFGTLLCFLTIHAQSTTKTFYFLAVTSQAIGDTTETLCVTVKPVSQVLLQVNLELKNNKVNLLKEPSINREYYRCVPFQVPAVSEESVAIISVHIEGQGIYQTNTTKILIRPSAQLIIIQTDKPLYKPGQTVKFRIVSLDSNFRTYIQTLQTIDVKDPDSNRIGQWLNVSTSRGLVDLSYPLNSEATNGIYVITVWNNKDEAISQSFEVKDYVLPTFEVIVQVPPVITILNTQATLTVCAKYTYGKPVTGTVNATVCHNAIRYSWIRPGNTIPPDICKDYIMKTDKTGCGQQVINLNELAFLDSRYEVVINFKAKVEEFGTGVMITGSGSSFITPNIVSLSFEDSPTVFKLGMVYEGKINVTGPTSNPLRNKVVYLTVSVSNSKDSVYKLITNDKGIANFSLETITWSLESVSLQAHYETTSRLVENKENTLTPQYPPAYLTLQPFYSISRSFIQLMSSSGPFNCSQKALIEAQYLIHDEGILPQQTTLSFYYMVMSRGHLVQYGRLTKTIYPVKGVTENRGKLVLSLENMMMLSPVAQVVLYTVLSSGETIADSRNFPIQLCLPNKVSLHFAQSTELPGGQVAILLKATPGSLCSVRAIDQSLLLLQSENELNTESVFNRLPIQTLRGYPYTITDDNPDQCVVFRRMAIVPRFPYDGRVDVYRTFEDVGIKFITNTIVKKPSVCDKSVMYMRGGEVELNAAASGSSSVPSPGSSSGSLKSVVTIRKNFPETWIWDLVSVSDTGAMAVRKTVPDSITKWQGDAFCTSPVGFGVAPKTELTAFQPFFVSLTMPSSVIRGEVFTLKATVFNYLQSCMMVEVSLANSKQFSVQLCKDCSYTGCLCADESRTVYWTITPLVLGQVSINVTGAAVQSKILCGKNTVTVPEKGRIDTIIKTLKVLPEGTKQYKSINEFLCPNGLIEKTVSLNLPAVFVQGSAMVSVSVLGDLMGRALQNLASLLAMPYGCGEQNMLLFAPNIFIMEYLESTNQLTPAIRSTAQTYLVSGYQRELTYKHTDGSYSAFGMSDPSGNTWLTAFVMKSFGKAKWYIFIDQVFVDQAKTWLGQQQQNDGCFASVGQLFHSELKGGVNDNVTLSAYVVAAMLELGSTVTDPIVSKGLTYLRNAYTQVNSTYTKALLFYTFTLAGDQVMRNTLISVLHASSIVSGGGRHWGSTSDASMTGSLEVETTSYVLLALMSGPLIPGFELGYSSSIVQWLSRQQNSFGGFASTQDTVVALQALAKYSLVTYGPSGSLTVTISSPSKQITTFTITQSNRLLYQETQLRDVPGDFIVRAQGNGCVYVQFTLSYNIPPPPDRSSFTISASANGNCRALFPSLKLTVTVTYNGQRVETNMVVISVMLLSGFSVDETSVKLVSDNSKSGDGSVQRVDQADGEVIIYLNSLLNGSQRVYTMTITQEFEVTNLKPAVVKVYDYYEISDTAVTGYSSPCA